MPDSEARRFLLIFKLADRLAAFPLEEVEQITPMAELSHPPGLPPALAGILDLAGVAIPVLRLDRLFGLAEQRPGLYSMLVILRGPIESSIAIFADRVNEILQIPDGAFRRIDPEDSFNGCAEATVTVRGDTVHVLSTARVFLAKERALISEFQVIAQGRLNQWKAGPR